MRQVNTISEACVVGIDLGDKSSVFCALCPDGTVLRTGTVDTDWKSFKHAFSPGGFTAVIETSTHSPWVCEKLTELGCEVIVANPRRLPLIYREANKSDRNDAEKLARLGRVDPELLSPIQHRPMAFQADLAIVKSRDTLVRSRASLVNAVRSFVKVTGERLPTCGTSAFAKKVREFIPESLQPALLPLLDQIAHHDESIRKFDRQLDQLALERYPETQAMTQISGVGNLIALTFLLTLASRERFGKSRTVGAFLGLVPRRDQSGSVDKQLPISKAGNCMMRRLLVSSAHYILSSRGPDSDLKRFGERLAARGGGRAAKKKAVVAVARKLSVLMHKLWVTGEVYEPLRNSEKVQAA